MFCNILNKQSVDPANYCNNTTLSTREENRKVITLLRNGMNKWEQRWTKLRVNRVDWKGPSMQQLDKLIPIQGWVRRVAKTMVLQYPCWYLERFETVCREQKPR